jgi:hypothetical protein
MDAEGDTWFKMNEQGTVGAQVNGLEMNGS